MSKIDTIYSWRFFPSMSAHRQIARKFAKFRVISQNFACPKIAQTSPQNAHAIGAANLHEICTPRGVPKLCSRTRTPMGPRICTKFARQEHRCENRTPRNCTTLHEICTPRTSPQKLHASRCTKSHEIARNCTNFARQEHRRRNRTPAVARNCTNLHEIARNLHAKNIAAETARQPLHEIARNCTNLHEIARNLHAKKMGTPWLKRVFAKIHLFG